MCRKLYNRLSILVMFVIASCRLSMCALYPDLYAGQGEYQQYQAATVFTGPICAQQPESLDQLPPLQVLLGSSTPDDLARVLAAIRARTVSLDMQDNLGQTALHVAAQEGHLEVVQELLAAGANQQLRDQRNRTALYYAQYNNHHAIINLLQPQVLQPIQQNVQNTQVSQQEHARQNTDVHINFKEFLLWGCATGALALLAYKLAHNNTEAQSARY